METPANALGGIHTESKSKKWYTVASKQARLVMNDLTACYNNISLFSSLASRILSSEEGSVYGGPSHSLLYNTRYEHVFIC